MATTEVIRRWINDNGRWNSPKYLGGESYGTTRSAVLAGILEEQDNIDLVGMACDGFIDAVVDGFLGQVVGAAGVGIHAGPAFDRIQAGQDFDVGGVVAGTHRAQAGSGRGSRAGCAPRAGTVKARGHLRGVVRI